MVKFVYSLLVFMLSVNPMLPKTVSNIEWIKTISGIDYNFSSSVCNDKKGNVYITGSSRQATNFGNGIVENFFDSVYGSFFLAKYTTDGKCLWVKKVKTIGGARNFIFRSIDICNFKICIATIMMRIFAKVN